MRKYLLFLATLVVAALGSYALALKMGEAPETIRVSVGMVIAIAGLVVLVIGILSSGASGVGLLLAIGIVIWFAAGIASDFWGASGIVTFNTRVRALAAIVGMIVGGGGVARVVAKELHLKFKWVLAANLAALAALAAALQITNVQLLWALVAIAAFRASVLLGDLPKAELEAPGAKRA